MQKNGDGTAKQIARWVALGALFLVPLAPLVVANTFFFPFITGKAFYLRVVIEIASVAWLALALLDREYRPRFSWIGAAVVGFVVWMFIADAFAPNAAKAFWSNFERMEGWVLLVHLLGFFFAASAVLRVEKKWRAWFLWSLIVAVIISGHALFQLAGSTAIHQGSTRIDASLGNSAYLAIYLLFSTFVAGWLALTQKRVWLAYVLVAFAVIEAVLIFFTETRGTVIGLAVGCMLVALLTALTASARARRAAFGALILLLILTGSFYLARNSAFVQESHVLQRVASISLADGRVRFTIWHMAFQGVRERPLTGWGQEGFNYVFNKYYDPSLYAQEPWFDRAHSAFIDWLTAGGIPAFLLYLSLFGTAIVLLWRSSELSRPERIALTAALVGYAVHNFFVFDNLYSYIYFFAILALIDSQVARKIQKLESAPVVAAEGGTTYVLPVCTVALIALVWSVNIPGMRVAAKLITALSPSSAGVHANYAAFEDLVAHPSFAAQEIREQLTAFAVAVVQNPSATNEEKQQAVTLAMREMRKQVASYPLDARERLQLNYLYRAIGAPKDALSEVLAAAALSPNKEAMWIEAGVTAWDLGDMRAAQEYFNKAYALGPQFQDLAVYAAAGDIAAGDQEKADQVLLAAYGTTAVDSDVISVAYYRAKDWPRLIALWKRRTALPDASVQAWFSLAAAYYQSGDKAGAVRTIRSAIALHPEMAASGAAAIAEIEGEATGK